MLARGELQGTLTTPGVLLESLRGVLPLSATSLPATCTAGGQGVSLARKLLTTVMPIGQVKPRLERE